jgi:hypothetical protein
MNAFYFFCKVWKWNSHNHGCHNVNVDVFPLWIGAAVHVPALFVIMMENFLFPPLCLFFTPRFSIFFLELKFWNAFFDFFCLEWKLRNIFSEFELEKTSKKAFRSFWSKRIFEFWGVKNKHEVEIEIFYGNLVKGFFQ